MPEVEPVMIAVLVLAMIHAPVGDDARLRYIASQQTCEGLAAALDQATGLTQHGFLA
jgi:hypothetical protein